jgi:hypothetical protein
MAVADAIMLAEKLRTCGSGAQPKMLALIVTHPIPYQATTLKSLRTVLVSRHPWPVR